MHFIRDKHLPLTTALRTAAESTLNAEIGTAAQRLMDGQLTPGEVLEAIRGYQAEARSLECSIEFDPLRRALEAVIERHVAALPQDAGHAQIPRLALEVAQELQLGLNLWRVQNLFWQYLTGGTMPPDLPIMFDLGTRLGFNQAVLRKLLHMPHS
jgi:hypothetical protein